VDYFCYCWFDHFRFHRSFPCFAFVLSCVSFGISASLFGYPGSHLSTVAHISSDVDSICNSAVILFLTELELIEPELIWELADHSDVDLKANLMVAEAEAIQCVKCSHKWKVDSHSESHNALCSIVDRTYFNTIWNLWIVNRFQLGGTDSRISTRFLWFDLSAANVFYKVRSQRSLFSEKTWPDD